jgi:hypothetical protein
MRIAMLNALFSMRIQIRFQGFGDKIVKFYI